MSRNAGCARAVGAGSVKKRSPGSAPAERISQIKAGAKAMVGLILGVKRHTEGCVLLECLLRKSAWATAGEGEELNSDSTAAAPGPAPPSEAEGANLAGQSASA